MYCTNCGRKLPEDGSPCVCRRQPAQPEQQTYTQPVQPQQNYGAPTQNFQMPPQYYAQLPVRPVTPVHGDPLFGEFAVSDHRKPVPAGSGVYCKSDLQQPAV